MPDGCSDVYHPSYPLKTADYKDPPNDQKEPQTFPVHLPRDITPTAQTLIEIGHGEQSVRVPPLGFGTWSWGDLWTYGWGPSGGYDKRLNDESCYAAFEAVVEAFPEGVSPLLDTAEHYGYTDGYVEQTIGRSLDRCNTSHPSASNYAEPPFALATKYLPTPWRHPWKYPDQVLKSMRGSLERTHVPRIDICQLHGPSNFFVWPTFKTLADSLAEAWKTGKVKTIGVCNLGMPQIKYMYYILKKHGIQLVSNQVEFSLVRMDPWKTGLIQECRKLGIATIAYSPLAVGRLTGKYTAQNKPQGNRNFGDVQWSKIEPIVDELISLGEKYGKTPAQVALNWVMCKGAIPIPAVKNREQVEDCLGALGWKLAVEDEERLDALGCWNDWDWNMFKHFQNWWWELG